MERMEQLDSMRGLAAATVVIGHCLGVLAVFWTDTRGEAGHAVANALKYTPFSVLIAGHEAVMFFFALSGFVLMLPFLAGKFASFGSFVGRRVLRIYIPYYGALALALLLRGVIEPPAVNRYSEWIGLQWQMPVTWESVVQHLLLVGHFDAAKGLDPVIWSLVHEMRISLVFPLIAWIVLKWNWKAVALLLPVFSVVGYGVHALGFHNPRMFGGWFQVLDSLQYVPMFMAGALLAKHRQAVIRAWVRMNVAVKALALAIGWIAYTYPYTILPGISAIHKPFMNEFAALIGALAAISAAISSSAFRRVLLWRPVHMLGKMSYSLYLYHFVILMAVLWTMPSSVPLPAAWAIVVALSIAASWASYRWVELPSIRLGKVWFGRRPRMDRKAILEQAG